METILKEVPLKLLGPFIDVTLYPSQNIVKILEKFCLQSLMGRHLKLNF